MRERVSNLEARLKELEHNRLVMRSKRDRSGIAKIGIVGYTNAGKSTLLNKLTDAGVLSENKLFATLDATTRKSELPNGETVLFTDTVGFIRNLPHHLVKAFKSTLDEVVYSDLLLIVADASDPESSAQIAVTEQVIEELGAKDKPRIYVYNKCDVADLAEIYKNEDTVFISSKTGEGIDTLLDKIIIELSKLKKEYKLLFPYDAQSSLNSLYKSYSVLSAEYIDSGVLVSAILDEKGKGIYSRYIKPFGGDDNG